MRTVDLNVATGVTLLWVVHAAAYKQNYGLLLSRRCYYSVSMVYGDNTSKAK